MSQSSRIASAFKAIKLPTVLALVVVLGATSLPFNSFWTAAQQMPGREISFPVTIHWNKQKGVSSYRLQIAGDDRFRDVFLDRRVSGERYVVNGLPSGYYYWRLTPADFGRANFSRPVRFFVSGGVIKTVKVSRRAASVGL